MSDHPKLQQLFAAVMEGHCPYDDARLQRIEYEAEWGPRGQWARCPTCGNKWRARADPKMEVDQLGQRFLLRAYE